MDKLINKLISKLINKSINKWYASKKIVYRISKSSNINNYPYVVAEKYARAYGHKIRK